MNTKMTEDTLQAHVDGRLPAAEREQVEAYLADHPEEAARLASYCEQAEALRRAFDPVLQEAIPASLKIAANPPPTRGWAKLADFRRMAASVLLVVLGGAAGWVGHGVLQAPSATALAPLPHQAAVAHVVYAPDLKRPVEVAAEQEAQLVKWLSKRLDAPMQIPQLGELGYELVGGRLLPGNRGPVAQLMYQSAGGARMTLYVSREYAAPSETAFRFAQEGSLNVFYWVDSHFGYALSGEMDKASLAKVSAAVYAQLSPQPEH